MFILSEIDLSAADIELFEAFEMAVLPRLAIYGARLESRLRSVDQTRELHILYFPDSDHLSQYINDPVRQEEMQRWKACGARSSTTEVISMHPRSLFSEDLVDE